MRRIVLTVAIVSALAAPALAQERAALSVVVSMKPIHALVAQVMDGIAKPALLVDGTQSPHTYAMKPSDARTLNQANVFFRVSPSVESFTVRAINGLPKTVRVVTLEEAPGVKRLPRRDDPNFKTIKVSGGGHAHGHAHGGEKAKGGMDGHVWLDPDNAKAITRHIATVLSDISPANAAAFRANADKAITRLDTLSAEMEAALAGAAGKPYVVFHDAYQYLETRFRLTPAGSVVIDPDTPPSGKRLSDLRAQISALGIRCVFSEPSFETRVVQSIIEGTPARTAALDPEATRVAAGVDAYDELMRSMARAIRGCLAPAS
jgi:zinc transport system substrate-binding protein